MSLRIGVLGASRIAEAAIVRPAAELGHRLVAVAARDRSRAEAFAQAHDAAEGIDDPKAVLDRPRNQQPAVVRPQVQRAIEGRLST